MPSQATISQSDLNRIVSSIEGNHSTQCNAPRKEQLKQISDKRVAGWQDTLAAKRKQKLEWKAEKERQEEASRKLQDAREADLREKQRYEALSNADRLVREQSEKVRQFRSKQRLVETLDTRDAQIKEREKKHQNDVKEETQWHQAVVTNMEEADKRSLELSEIEKRKARELSEDLRRQRDERTEQLRLQHERKRAEEEALVRKIAVDELAAEKREMQLKNERRAKAKEEMKTNDILLKIRQEQLTQKEQALTQKCEEEIARRNKLNAARIALEKRHSEEKQAKRKILSDRACEDLKQRAMREFEIFERDQQMRYQKERERAEAEKQKQELDKMAIDDCRKKQIMYRSQQVEADKQLGQLYVEQLNRITRERQEAERQKELIKREQNVEIRKLQQQQCIENERRRAKEADALKQEQQQVFHDLKNEDDVFKDFVMKEIANFAIQGKRTALLEKTLNP
jgi:trichohyalin|eukprot:scaffold2856_cov189-Alexandrium_tamarense.AAC.12